MTATEELLRRLAANDEPSLQKLLCAESQAGALDRGTRALVQLSALLVLGAPIASLRWAVDLAGALGIDDEALVQVLMSASSAAGTAQIVGGAPRLALALGLDLDSEGSNEPQAASRALARAAPVFAEGGTTFGVRNLRAYRSSD